MVEPEALWMVGHLKREGAVPLYHTPQDCAAGLHAVATLPPGARVRVHYPWPKEGDTTGVPVAYCEQDTGKPLWNYCCFSSFRGFSPL